MIAKNYISGPHLPIHQMPGAFCVCHTCYVWYDLNVRMGAFSTWMKVLSKIQVESRSNTDDRLVHLLTEVVWQLIINLSQCHILLSFCSLFPLCHLYPRMTSDAKWESVFYLKGCTPHRPSKGIKTLSYTMAWVAGMKSWIRMIQRLPLFCDLLPESMAKKGGVLWQG